MGIINTGTTLQNATVDTPSLDYIDMSKRWELPEALKEGVEALRNEKWLPKEPKESDAAYTFRKNRSFLFNLYWRVITSITGLAFVKPVSVANVPKELEYLQWDFDGNNRSLTEFAYDMTIDAIHFGLAHATVDFPETESDVVTLKDYNERQYRPFGVLISPRNLIGSRHKRIGSKKVLDNVRIHEVSVEPYGDDDWSEKIVHYIRVIKKDTIDVYKSDLDSGKGYYLYEVLNNPIGDVPIVTAYSNKKGDMKGYPALSDLAQTNLCHFQSSSDQRNILHIARVPILLATGFSEEELENMEIGANRIISTTSSDADIRHVEHSGSALNAGQNDLDKLEEQMATLGADLLLAKGVSRQTATARRLDQNESMSTLQLTLRSVERCIEVMYEIAGKYIGVDASEVSVSIGDDLSVVTEPNPTTALIALKQTGLLTDQQVVDQAKRQGILSTDFELDPKRPSEEQIIEASLSNNTNNVIPQSDDTVDGDEDSDNQENDETNNNESE